MSYLGTLEFVTTTDVMREFRVARRTVRRWVAAGELIPHSALRSAHGEHRFRLEEVEAFRQRRRAGQSMDDVIAGALAYIRENQAEGHGMLCPSCVARQVNRHGDYCTKCEQQRLLEAGAA